MLLSPCPFPASPYPPPLRPDARNEGVCQFEWANPLPPKTPHEASVPLLMPSNMIVSVFRVKVEAAGGWRTKEGLPQREYGCNIVTGTYQATSSMRMGWQWLVCVRDWNWQSDCGPVNYCTWLHKAHGLGATYTRAVKASQHTIPTLPRCCAGYTPPLPGDPRPLPSLKNLR